MKADMVYCSKLYDDGLIDWLNISNKYMANVKPRANIIDAK